MVPALGGRGKVAAAVSRRRTLRQLVPCAAIVALGCAPVADAAAPPELRAVLDGWTAQHPQTGVLVVRLDAAGPTEILSYKAELPRRPASTMKVVTASAALIALGPDHRYETRLYASPSVAYAGDTLLTHLYLKGYGDPTLGTPAYVRRYLGGSGTNVNRLAAPFRVSDVRKLRGRIVVDEGYFDSRRRVTSWPARYNDESPPLSAVNVNQGYLGDRQGKYVRRPPLAAGVQLREALKRMGVTHTGRVTTGRVPADARPITTLRSPRLRTIVRRMLVPSDNYIAETMVKGTGAIVRNEGSTAAGTAAAAGLLGQFLTPADVLVDGSGLDRGNRLSPRTLVSVLTAANNNANWGAALIDGLPRGGEGTLRRRFLTAGLRGRVRAKTGYINETTTLAGYVDSPSGVRYAYALLMNDDAITAARTTQNRIVAMLGTGIADQS